MMMEARHRVRKKHWRVALSSEEEEDDDEYEQQEQQARRANVQVPTQRGSRQVAAPYYSDDDNDDDDDDDDEDVEMGLAVAPMRSTSVRKKQRSSSSGNGVYTMQTMWKSAITKQSKKLSRPLSAASSTSNSPSLSLLAATAASSSASVGAASPRVLNVMLTIGDWLDVLDYVGVWNVGQVLSIPSDDSVEVRYDGWGKRYNEVVPLNSSRVAPFHTYTWSVKCWAKYLNWPWWPAVLTVRTPGTKDGADNLRAVEQVYVDFVDSKKFASRCRCWVNKRDVVPFDANFEQLRKKTNGTDFEFSLKHVLKATATTKFPTFVRGTLTKQYESTVTMPVRKMKKVMGNAMWLKDFANNRERHNRMHGCHNAIVGSQDGKDEVTAILGLQEELGRQLEEQKEKSKLPRTPKRRRNKENEVPKSPHSGKQVSPRSPRVVVADNTTNVILPQNVIFHSDDIIVEDEEEDEDGRGKKKKEPLTRATSHKRLWSITKTAKTAKVKDTASSYGDSDGESEDKSEEESDESEDTGRVSLPRAVGREIAAKERHDPRKRVLRPLADTTPPTKKRPNVARNLWLQSFTDRINSVKKEPRKNTEASPPRVTGGGDTNGGDNDSNNSDVSDYEGDEDYGITTEENSEEQLRNVEDDVVPQAVPAPSPISVLGEPNLTGWVMIMLTEANDVLYKLVCSSDIEDFEMLEVKTVESWTGEQEKQETKTKVTKEELTPVSVSENNQKPKRLSPAKQAAPPATPAKPKKKTSPPRKRPTTAATTVKRKPPRTLMDTRMAQAQEAIRALEEEEEKTKEEALSSAAERRSISNLRRVKGSAHAVRSVPAFSTSLAAFPGLSLPERRSSPPTVLQPPTTELSDDDDASNLQVPIAFPGLSDVHVKKGKKRNGAGGVTGSTRPAKARKTRKESLDPKENRAVNEENEQKTDNDENNDKVDEDDEENDDDVVPRLRRRFCMMRASTRVGESLTAQQKVRVFQTKKKDGHTMRVRAPNMFPDPQSAVSTTTTRSTSLSEIPLPVFGSSGELTHSMLRITDSPSLTRLSSSSDRVGVAGGGSDQTGPIFSSNADFSINSWFKQRLC